MKNVPISSQVYHLVRPANFAIDGFDGEKVFAKRFGDQIKEQFRSESVGGCKQIKKGGESYVIRVK